jgi:predicted PurR-regulated permease PerM
MAKYEPPFYQKLAYILFSIGLLSVALYFGRELILPILFSVLLATLLLPVTRFLRKKKLPRVLSILLPLILTIILGGGVIYFLSAQVIHFSDDLPALKERLGEVADSIQGWVNSWSHISIYKQNEYIGQGIDNLKEKAPQIAGNTVGSITGILTYVVLLPVYTFLILYYRNVIKTFIVMSFSNGSDSNGSEQKVNDILTDAVVISQKYISGLLIETTIVFTLNTIGFLILGVKYAIFMALLAALLNLIPYVGMLTANIICMVITLISADAISSVIWVGIVLGVVQIIDNNFGMPLIVGNKVKINALVTIIGVLIGGALSGVPGMFLAIPVLAIIKVICDKVEALKPWAVLLGDTAEDH